MTENEYQLVAKEAKKNNMTLSAYIMRNVHETQVYTVDGIEEVIKLEKIIGTQLDDIQRKLQDGFFDQSALRPVTDSFHTLLDHIQKILEVAA